MMTIKILESLLEPTLLLDRDGQIIWMNEACAQLLQVPARKLLRQKIKLTQFLKFERELKELNQLPQITEPTSYVETTFVTQENIEGRVQISIQPFDSSTKYLVYMRDVNLEQTLQKKYRRELEAKIAYIQELEEAKAQLEDYSKNLEIKVQERTLELRYANRQMEALINSLDQGFLIFH